MYDNDFAHFSGFVLQKYYVWITNTVLEWFEDKVKSLTSSHCCINKLKKKLLILEFLARKKEKKILSLKWYRE